MRIPKRNIRNDPKPAATARYGALNNQRRESLRNETTPHPRNITKARLRMRVTNGEFV
jgi:hypothetical protein